MLSDPLGLFAVPFATLLLGKAEELDRLSEVIPGLFIGSYGTAESPDVLKAAGITYTLSLAEEVPGDREGRNHGLETTRYEVWVLVRDQLPAEIG